jgi:putative membrane-bound dehydrogenase-like protein
LSGAWHRRTIAEVLDLHAPPAAAKEIAVPIPTTRRGGTLLLVLALSAGWFLLPPLRSERPAAGPNQGNGRKGPPFKVPPGFVVEKVAAWPLVEHPMMACFDERGRLFIAEAAGKNLPFPVLVKDPPNRIRLLQDTRGSGTFDKSTVFADRMTFPMGVLWHDGALYAASAPSLWKLEDTRGTGVADRRQELVGKFGSSGNGADIHGPFLGPDGRLYWTDGRHGHEIRRGGKVMKGLAARIFRCRPDGSDLEVVCGGGMDDPVEIAFTAEGEPLVTVDILIGSPRRIDAIIYAIEGGVYPYHPCYKEFKSTGDLLPPVADLGWVAPAGLMRYRSDAFGPEYRGNLFSAQFNRRRIVRHVLERDGATFRTRTEDFLVASDPDFHPTDVLEDADGSLLVIDTGGWFRIGCPASRIAKPEIKGAIYRVRRKDAPRLADPRGLKLAWDRLAPRELAKLLDDPRFAVRDQAIHLLAKRQVVELRKMLGAHPSVRARRNAVWALTRMNGAKARAGVRAALQDREESVRLAAAHSVGLNGDREAGRRLMEMVASARETAAVRREAATALGRTTQGPAVSALFQGLRLGGDRFLEHALIYALIRGADREALLRGLRDPSPVIRRAALIALDQMDGGNLTRDLVTPLLNTDDPALQQTALAVITSRPGWAREIVGLLRQWLTQNELDRTRRESLRGALLAFCKDREIQGLVASTLGREQTPVVLRLLLLETMARAPLDRLPETWVRELGKSLSHRDERVVRQAVAAIRAANVTAFDSVLLDLGRNPAAAADLRVAALAAAVPRLARLEPAVLAFLEKRLGKDRQPLERLAAAEVLGGSRLDDTQLLELADLLAGSGALELPHLLAAFERSKSSAVGKKLIAALDRAPGLQSLTAEMLRRSLRSYPAEVREAATPLLKRLDVDEAAQQARLVELKPVLSGGDSARGRALFFGKKATCAACHTIRSEGGRVGPDLSKIGSIRTAEDLLESIVFPSASLVRGYEPYVIETRDGKVHKGIIAHDTAEVIYLRTAELAEVRIPRSAVDSIRRDRVSIMPQGLDAQLSRQELADLIAFLRSLK